MTWLLEVVDFRAKSSTLSSKHSYWKWPFIVDLPIRNGGYFHFVMLTVTSKLVHGCGICPIHKDRFPRIAPRILTKVSQVWQLGTYLIGGLEPWNFMTFHSVGNFIIPSDELIFFRGVGEKPPTSIYSRENSMVSWDFPWKTKPYFSNGSFWTIIYLKKNGCFD